MSEMDEFEFEAAEQPQEAFHIELDLYESGDYSNVLVVPCNDTFIVVAGDEHLCTMQKTCDEPVCWEQQDGTLEDDMVERIGAAISAYISQL
jgi:hypothetical protein